MTATRRPAAELRERVTLIERLLMYVPKLRTHDLRDLAHVAKVRLSLPAPKGN